MRNTTRAVLTAALGLLAAVGFLVTPYAPQEAQQAILLAIGFLLATIPASIFTLWRLSVLGITRYDASIFTQDWGMLLGFVGQFLLLGLGLLYTFVSVACVIGYQC